MKPHKIFHRALLLQAYTRPRNKTQARLAIAYQANIELSMGRTVLPMSQEMLDQGLIERVDAPSSDSKGHFSLITPKGLSALNEYHEGFRSIGDPNPNFGY